MTQPVSGFGVVGLGVSGPPAPWRLRHDLCAGHGEGMIEHRLFAAGFSPFDHTDPCGCCQGITDLDGVCRVFDAHWERWRQHPRLAPCRVSRRIA